MRKRIVIILTVCAMILTCNSVYADEVSDMDVGDSSIIINNEELAELPVSADPEGYTADDHKEPESGYVPAVGEQVAEDSVSLQEDAGFEWDVTDNVLTISGTGDLPDYSSATVPWAEYVDSISGIVINEGITGISNRLFMQMNALETVSFPSTLTTIGQEAFCYCPLLDNVTIPDGVTEVLRGTFAECESLKSLDLGDGVTTIDEYAFQDVHVEHVNIPASLINWSSLAFWGDVDIISYEVEEGNPAYISEDGIIFSPDKTTLIQFPAARGETYRIPDGTTVVASYAFARNQRLVSVDLNSVEILEEGAFYLCNISSTIVLPDTLTECGYFTFDSCHYLQGVVFGAGMTETPYRMFENCWNLSNIVFNPSLNVIGMRTFNYCSSLRIVEVPDTVTEIQGAFGYCTSLAEFTANSIEDIWYANFAGDYNLKTVNLGNVKTINRQSFYGCTALSEINLPESTEFVEETAFPQTTNIICANSELTPYGRNGLQKADQIMISGKQHYDMAFQVLELVNEERAQNGLSALTMDVELLDVAMLRAAEGSVLFSHTRPDSSICFSASSRMYAENIALGQNTAAAAMNSWMNSEGHKANILNQYSTYIGIGCFEINGTYVWVQNFDYGGDGAATNVSDHPGVKDVKEHISLPCRTFTEAPTSAGIIWVGSEAEYSYSYSITCNPAVAISGSAYAVMYVNNPAWSLSVQLENECVSWSSNNPQIASVDANGKITGITAGSAEITGALQYSAASKSITVMGQQTGPYWVKDGSDWYLYSKDGSVLNGWQKVNGKWYYLDPNAGGKMAVGWRFVNGKWYYLKTSGAMATGWLKDGNTWYYLKSSGAMAIGWLKDGSTWYYLKSSGAMAANEWCEGYWLSKNGAWTYKYKGSWHKNSKGWWFGDTSGWYAKNSVVQIDGVNYWFDTSGYWIDSWDGGAMTFVPMF